MWLRPGSAVGILKQGEGWESRRNFGDENLAIHRKPFFKTVLVLLPSCSLMKLGRKRGRETVPFARSLFAQTTQPSASVMEEDQLAMDSDGPANPEKLRKEGARLDSVTL
jgi:hypothetical protein